VLLYLPTTEHADKYTYCPKFHENSHFVTYIAILLTDKQTLMLMQKELVVKYIKN